jgi:hypothetical protein
LLLPKSEPPNAYEVEAARQTSGSKRFENLSAVSLCRRRGQLPPSRDPLHMAPAAAQAKQAR